MSLYLIIGPHQRQSSASASSSFMADFDEYEQQQPSPWSHSPAPSPALMDLDVNPFFQSVPDIDDDAFNPDTSEFICTNSSIPFPPPASNAHSLIHIPIVHPPDFDEGNSKSSSTKTNLSKCYPTPIAILSFLSPVVPYPVVLLKCLRSLQAFIATSLSNALAYSRMVQNRFSTDLSGAGKSGRKPLLRRHSHKIKRWSSQTFARSSDASSDASSTSSSSSSSTSWIPPKPLHNTNGTAVASVLPSHQPSSSLEDNVEATISAATDRANHRHQHRRHPRVKNAAAFPGDGSNDSMTKDRHHQKQGIQSAAEGNVVIQKRYRC